LISGKFKISLKPIRVARLRALFSDSLLGIGIYTTFLPGKNNGLQ
jgi:hypothetical protein